MLDLIRESMVPANLMHSAARGSLSVSPPETLEILVYLALHHKGLGQQARLTLAGWDEAACLSAASNPATSSEVLAYFASPENLRMPVLPALFENPAVTEKALSELAGQGTRAVAEVLMASKRAMSLPDVLRELQANPNLKPSEVSEITNKLNAQARQHAAQEQQTTGEAVAPSAAEHAADPASEETLAGFLKENAAELEAEKDKPFRPLGSIHEELPAEALAADAVAHKASAPHDANASSDAHSAVAARVAAPMTAAAAAAAHAKKHAVPGHVERRDSTLQKIAKLDVKGRIALAVRGSKEERSILIRDGTKLVALAVLESPKVSDGEVEGFALQKNVLEAVLRQIPLKRRFAKNYNIMRNLVFNPRTPIDLSLGLMKGLLVHDLRNLSGNKEVSETIRKLALRMYKQKSEKRQ